MFHILIILANIATLGIIFVVLFGFDPTYEKSEAGLTQVN